MLNSAHTFGWFKATGCMILQPHVPIFDMGCVVGQFLNKLAQLDVVRSLLDLSYMLRKCKRSGHTLPYVRTVFFSLRIDLGALYKFKLVFTFYWPDWARRPGILRPPVRGREKQHVWPDTSTTTVSPKTCQVLRLVNFCFFSLLIKVQMRNLGLHIV